MQKGYEEGRKSLLSVLQQLLTFRFNMSCEYLDPHLQSMELKTLEQLIETAYKAQTFTEFEKAVEKTVSLKVEKDL